MQDRFARPQSAGIETEEPDLIDGRIRGCDPELTRRVECEVGKEARPDVAPGGMQDSFARQQSAGIETEEPDLIDGRIRGCDPELSRRVEREAGKEARPDVAPGGMQDSF